MNQHRAERAIHLLSVAGIWLTFFAVWGSTGRHMKTLTSRGADLPGPTLLWLEIAGSWVTFLIPVICTGLIIWAVRRANPHANWMAGAVLCFGLFYAVAAHTAVILPTFTLCGPV